MLLVLLAISSATFSGIVFSPVAEVHAQGGFEYALSTSGGVILTPGNSGSTNIIATLTSGTASNVTLSCDLTDITNITIRMGTSCSFDPVSVIPTFRGNATTVTVIVPASATYSAFNITVDAKAGSPSPIAPTFFTVTVAAKVAVKQSAIASQSYTVGSSITVEFNLTGSPHFGGYQAAVFFNEAVLRYQSADYSGGVFGTDAQVSSECLDLFTPPDVASPSCNVDLSFDGPGVFSLGLYTGSGKNTNTTSGELFIITFKVASIGFSPIHFVYQEVKTLPDGILLQTVAYDGYFTNKLCGNSLCRPPLVSLTSPVRPVALRPVSFNATAVSQNPGGTITYYNWTWGLGRAKQYHNSPSRNVTIVFNQFGVYQVSVAAQDQYNATNYYTVFVTVFRIWVDLGLLPLAIDHPSGVSPGTIIHIVATAVNNGVNPENSTFVLSINNNNLTSMSIQNLAPDVETTLTYDWNTTSYSPRVYRVQADLAEVRNATTGQLLENDTAINNRGLVIDPNNVKVALVQLIIAIPSGFGLFLGLNLPTTFGVGIVLIAVLVFVGGLVKKARAKGPEPL